MIFGINNLEFRESLFVNRKYKYDSSKYLYEEYL